MQPWDRQKNEKFTSFELFTIYRDSGSGRNIGSISGSTGKSVESLKNIADRNDWEKRASEFDKYISEIRGIENNYASAEGRSDKIFRSLDVLIDRFSGKIDSNDEELEGIKIENLVKLIAAVWKTAAEAKKIDETLNDGHDLIDNEAAEKIRSDNLSATLAADLMNRLMSISK